MKIDYSPDSTSTYNFLKLLLKMDLQTHPDFFLLTYLRVCVMLCINVEFIYEFIKQYSIHLIMYVKFRMSKLILSKLY